MVAIVQSASNTGTGSSITITLGAGTTAADCVLSASIASGSSNPTVTGITLGGAADHWAHLVSAGDTGTSAGLVETWADPACAAGQTSVVISFSAASANGGCAFAYEASGLGLSNILDQSASAFTTTTQATFSSGTTPATAQASELWFGAVGGFSTTITGPGAPWVNSTQINSGSKNFMVGYQVVSAVGTATYSGSYSPNSFEEASVVTLFPALGRSLIVSQAVKRSYFY